MVYKDTKFLLSLLQATAFYLLSDGKRHSSNNINRLCKTSCARDVVIQLIDKGINVQKCVVEATPNIPPHKLIGLIPERLPMYDRVTAWIDRHMIGAERFEELRGLDNGKGWQIWGSMHFSFYENTIKCTGSLNKWRDGQNIVALTFAEVSEVVSDFCDSLGVQPSEVRVSGLEFGATLCVSQPPARYMELLGEVSRKKRLPTLSGRELQTIYSSSLRL